MVYQQNRDPNKQDSDWLNNKIDEEKARIAQSRASTNAALDLPKKLDDTLYTIEEANKEQKLIMLLILQTLKTWVECTTNPDITNPSDYKPLRMTIQGQAGTGKSFVLNLISTVLRTMFNTNTVDIKAAPTGSAAFNIDGQTCHSAFMLNCNKMDTPLTEERKDAMRQFMNRTLAILIDERSLLSSEVLGAMERNVADTAHGGGHSHEDWGGVPIVILMGDDRQLPPVRVQGKGSGAFQIFDDRARANTVERRGQDQFRVFAKTVVTLKKNQRVSDENSKFKAILDRLRMDDQTEADADTIINLTLPMDSEEKEAIENSPDTLHIFAFNKDREELNYKKLSNLNTADNPVAFIKNKKPKRGKQDHFKNTDIPKVTVLCRDCKVAIKGRNFHPQWGLFNGAMGTVDEIVYNDNEDPNSGKLPLYIAVRFPSYTGPQWDPEDPKIVPIPCITGRCDKGCCISTYVPLQMAFGRTVHTFQGMQAGKTKEGLPDNPVRTIIANVGTNGFEGNNPGLLYTTLSRATTIGETEGTQTAIYFQGLTKERYMYSARRKEDNDGTKTTQQRDKWIEHLSENEVDHDYFTTEQEQELIAWSKSTIPLSTLAACVENENWRQTLYT